MQGEHRPATGAPPPVSLRQALRSPTSLRQWLDATTFIPTWLPPRWRRAATCDGLAVLAMTGGVLATWLVGRGHPEFRFLSSLNLLLTLLVALHLGSRAGILAAVLNALLLDYLAIASQPGQPLGHVRDDASVALYLVVGIVVSVIASQERAGRRHALEAARALHESNQSREQFITIAGHELRNPLTGGLLALESQAARLERLAAGGPRHGEAAAQLVAILELNQLATRAVWRMDRLVTDLLDLSRIQANRLDLRPELIDLVTFVQEAVEAQRRATPGRSIGLEGDTAAPVLVRADADRVVQVVANYLANAARYSPDDTPIAVSVAVHGAVAWVGVRDWGPGVAPEDRARIWEPYIRAERATRPDQAGGLGMGLFISRAIIAQHGGEVGVESHHGGGATFWFALPLATSGDE